MSSINEQIQSVIVVGLSITLLGLVFVGLLARRLTSPLWQLTRVAGQFGSGDLAVRAKSSSGDTQEVVELAAAFNKMAYSIEQVQHELEVKVRELGTSNTSLQATLETLQRTQNELIQREKLASLGALVAGVAHEMNTPLGNSVTISSALVEDLNVFAIEAEAKTLTRSGLREFIAQMRDGLDILVRNLIRANTLVGNFKRVAADQSSELRRPFDLAETVHELVPTIAPQFKHTPHRILVDIPSGLLMDSFPGPLGQVLANLVLNALLHAFSNEMQGEVRVTAEKTLNEHIILRVSDNGRGIAPENLPRIFDPFFTTKLGQGGSGLGLHIVFNIVTATLGGSVRVDSKLGEGTCFTLDFPCVAPKPEQ